MTWRRAGSRLCLVVLVCVLVCSGVVLGVAAGSPDLDATVTGNRLVPGEETTLQVTLTNAGTLDTVSTTNPTLNQRVLTASGLSVTLGAGNAPLSVRSGPQGVGSLADGAERTIPFTVSVDEDAAPGTYRVPVTVEYRHAARIYERGGAPEYETTTERLFVTVEVVDRARFAVVETASDLRAGSGGTVTVTVENVGTAAANRTSVTLTSLDPTVSMDGTPAASRYLGTVPVGDTRTLSYAVSAPADARNRTYPFALSTNFTTADGAPASGTPVRLGIPVSQRPAFSLDGLDASLAVGETGTVRGTVTNDGAAPAEVATVVIASPSPNIGFPEPTYALGTVPPGASANFTFDTRVNGSSEAGPRPFTVRVQYRGPDGGQRESDPLQFSARVEPQPDRLTYTPVNATFETDSENRLAVRVRNVGTDRLEDVQLRLTATPPFTSDSPTAFVDDLAPTETRVLGFGLTVSEEAVESTQAVTLSATMDTADGRTVRTEPALVPVVIANPEGPGRDLTLVAGAAVLTVLIFGAGWWWLRN